MRAVLDIKGHYKHAVCFEVMPDAHAWVNVGLAATRLTKPTLNDEVYMVEQLVFQSAVSFFDDRL
jgi:hypothetical protein